MCCSLGKVTAFYVLLCNNVRNGGRSYTDVVASQGDGNVSFPPLDHHASVETQSGLVYCTVYYYRLPAVIMYDIEKMYLEYRAGRFREKTVFLLLMYCLKKNEISKRLGGIISRKNNSSWHLLGFPDGNCYRE